MKDFYLAYLSFATNPDGCRQVLSAAEDKEIKLVYQMKEPS